MIEAKITCTYRSVRIPDMGKVLVQGESFTVSEEVARKSADLAQLKQAGGVTVEYVKKPDMRPAPTNGHHPMTSRVASTPPVPAPPDQTTLLLQLQQDLAALRRELPVLVDKAVAKALADRDRQMPGKVEEIGPRKRKGGGQ
jgi:hypothetical protein